MSPKLRSLLARVTLVGGVAFVSTYLARSAPREQTIAVRLGAGRDVTRIAGVVTPLGEGEPSAGFSRDFSRASPAPRVVRHRFSAPNGTYIVVISYTERAEASDAAPDGGAGDDSQPRAWQDRPKLIETSFERRVSLAGGEVIVSPD